MEKVVEIKNVTKDYGKKRGNFNISFDVYENDTIGIIGENGAGKTTLLRQIMGFVKSDKGTIKILGHNAYKEAAYCKMFTGYVPGEINFPDVKTGDIFLHEYGKKLGVTDFKYANYLISKLQLDVTAYPKRMSKGMKQKTAIVAALMLQTKLVIMDEPTTGLDPLMRYEFLNIVEEQQKRGATIIMSSNSIDELEKVCNRFCFLSQGKVIDIVSREAILNVDFKDYEIVFNDHDNLESFIKDLNIINKKDEKNLVTIRVYNDEITGFLQHLQNFDIKYMNIIPYSITTYFDEKRKELFKE